MFCKITEERMRYGVSGEPRAHQTATRLQIQLESSPDTSSPRVKRTRAACHHQRTNNLEGKQTLTPLLDPIQTSVGVTGASGGCETRLWSKGRKVAQSARLPSSSRHSRHRYRYRIGPERWSLASCIEKEGGGRMLPETDILTYQMNILGSVH